MPENEQRAIREQLARSPVMAAALIAVYDVLESCWDHNEAGQRIRGDNPRSCSDVNDDLLELDALIHRALGWKQPVEVEEEWADREEE